MEEKNFISYEYKTVIVKAAEQYKATDMYEAFGWEINSTSSNIAGKVTLSMKRDRKQKHKQELAKLERQAEDLIVTIDSLQRSETMGASIFAYIFGIVSVLILGGGMCLVMLMENSTPAIVIGIVLGVIGIALCCINYLIYRKLADKKIRQVLPIIDANEEKLANLLEQGNDLLYAELI